MKYVIIQAGGRGSRLETLTANKPKALVAINNLPMIFHLFNQYPQAKFIIIADYKKDVLQRYLKVFANVDYEIVQASGNGTCAGIASALEYIPEQTQFMLIWCDLILSEGINIFSTKLNYIGISKSFTCRWSFVNDIFIEQSSAENGVAGLFVFKNKNLIIDVPQEGEFVRYLATKAIPFERLNMYNCLEIGTMLSYFQNELNKPRCRPFNKLIFKNDIVLKYPTTERGKILAKDEIAWYKKVKNLGYPHIPHICGYNPLVMNKINGQNVYEYAFLTNGFKKAILAKIIDALKLLHKSEKVRPGIVADCESTYITKTLERLSIVQDLVPFAKDDFVIINGRKCMNIFAVKDKIISDMRSMYPQEFCLIHGDCTFHNIMIETDNVTPILIDPRGYFGKTKLYGDVDYDWAKLYYSIVGNYDSFNRKNFSLEIKEKEVDLMIVSNNWEDLEDYFFIATGANIKKLKLVHALIWLSLTTYAWEDYDSICGAFYKGLWELQEYLDYVK